MADIYPNPLQQLFDAFAEEGAELYLVGGAVRDWALGEAIEQIDDLDFCTDARPRRTKSILEDHRFQTYDLGFEFGTVGCLLRGPDDKGYPKDCQITTYRSDEYYRRGSRHPEVEFGDTIEQDLGRRDFSINSMALDGRGELTDPYDGREDLEEGILRVIGDPSETLAEDPLRILRVGRFMSKLGFEPNDQLRQASYERADHLLEISRERWLQEMTKLVAGPHPTRAFHFLHTVRALGIMLPEVARLAEWDGREDEPAAPPWSDTLEMLERADAQPALRWGILLHAIGKPWARLQHPDGRVDYRRYADHGAMLFDGIRKRFRFDNDTADEVASIIGNHVDLPDPLPGEWSDRAVRQFVRQMDPYVETMIDFARASLTTDETDDRPAALASLEALEEQIDRLDRRADLRPQLPTGLGNELMATLELEPSPLIGELKTFLEEEIVAGRLENGRDARYYVDRLQNDPPGFLRDAMAP